MKVKEWISYEKAKEYQENEAGGLGGYFNFKQKGMSWEDYHLKENLYTQALKEEILAKNIKITGGEHQNSENGVPLFEDNTVATYSYRAWGDLMAAIWSEKENKDYCYMDFYM